MKWKYGVGGRVVGIIIQRPSKSEANQGVSNRPLEVSLMTQMNQEGPC